MIYFKVVRTVQNALEMTYPDELGFTARPALHPKYIICIGYDGILEQFGG